LDIGAPAPRLNGTGSFVLDPDPVRMRMYISGAVLLNSLGLQIGKKFSMCLKPCRIGTYNAKSYNKEREKL